MSDKMTTKVVSKQTEISSHHAQWSIKFWTKIFQQPHKLLAAYVLSLLWWLLLRKLFFV